MSALITTGLALDIHASHQPGSDPRLKLRAAASAHAALTAQEHATASRGLARGAAALVTLSAAVSATAGKDLLTGTSSFLGSVRAAIASGHAPTDVLGRATGITLPAISVSAAVTALLNAEGDVALSPDLAARAHMPILGGLLNLALRADENGMDWGVGVALPFASDMALAGSVTGDTAGAREAWLTLAWAYQRQVAT